MNDEKITPLSEKMITAEETQKLVLFYDLFPAEDVKEALKNFYDELKEIEIWECSPDEYLDKVNQLKLKHFGEGLI